MIILTFFLSLMSSASEQPIPADQLWPLQIIESTSPSSQLPLQRKIIVAVIDTGIDESHPWLKDHLWSNSGESGKDNEGKDKSTNGIDDDGNGLIDDLHGWNFVGQNNSLYDEHGHGSHVAGIITATSLGEFKLSKSSPIELMVLKYYDENSSGKLTLENTIKAIDYAVENGAHIINYSGGGLTPNPKELAALRRASAAGVLVVAAAGNESANTDIAGYFPANYPLSNILAIGATSSSSQVIESSNYGTKNVDLMAPGENIFSSLPGGGFGLMTGTSQATAFATGTAAMILASKSLLTPPQQIIEHLLKTGKPMQHLSEKALSSSLLNFKRALLMSFDNERLVDFEITNYLPITEQIFDPTKSWGALTGIGTDQTQENFWLQSLLHEAKGLDPQSLQ